MALPLTMVTRRLDEGGPFRVVVARDTVVVLGERHTGTCGLGARERDVDRASRHGDTLRLWLRREVPAERCKGTGLEYFYRAAIGGVPAGRYRLYVVEADARPDTVFRAEAVVPPGGTR